MQTDSELLGRVPAWLLCQEGGPMVSLELSSRVYPGFTVVALAGELDAAGAHAATAAIQACIGSGKRVVVDLGAVQFAACHGLGALAVAAKRARRAGGGVLLAAPAGSCAEGTGAGWPGRGVLCVCQRRCRCRCRWLRLPPVRRLGARRPGVPWADTVVKSRHRMMAADAAG